MCGWLYVWGVVVGVCTSSCLLMTATPSTGEVLVSVCMQYCMNCVWCEYVRGSITWHGGASTGTDVAVLPVRPFAGGRLVSGCT
jgi:hypothetical protein